MIFPFNTSKWLRRVAASMPIAPGRIAIRVRDFASLVSMARLGSLILPVPSFDLFR
jgi:hypothetical protein